MVKSLQNIYSLPSFKQKHQLEVKIKSYSDTFRLDLTDNNSKADCCVGHFGYNFYVRTNKGLKYQQYKSYKTMARAIKRTLKNNGLEFESLGLKRGYKYRVLEV